MCARTVVARTGCYMMLITLNFQPTLCLGKRYSGRCRLLICQETPDISDIFFSLFYRAGAVRAPGRILAVVGAEDVVEVGDVLLEGKRAGDASVLPWC